MGKFPGFKLSSGRSHDVLAASTTHTCRPCSYNRHRLLATNATQSCHFCSCRRHRLSATIKWQFSHPSSCHRLSGTKKWQFFRPSSCHIHRLSDTKNCNSSVLVHVTDTDCQTRQILIFTSLFMSQTDR